MGEGKRLMIKIASEFMAFIQMTNISFLKSISLQRF